MHKLVVSFGFANCSTVPIIVCADAQMSQCGGRERLHKATGVHSGDVLQLALHSSHHQTEYSFGGSLLEA
ncbi:MAG: hypothetical protein V7K97_12670 [Nostoc sp.]|uniref:hypothetical protein n=1 Tax=Nostoc sp. TaxID=1180 RepID=UPI002FFA3B6B